MSGSPRFGALDRFRPLAALLVVALHTYPLADVSPDAEFLLTRVLARLAVPFFLMATGQFALLPLLQPGGARRLPRFLRKTGLLYGACILLYLPLGIYGGQYAGLTPLSAVRLLLFDGTYYHLWYFPAALLGVCLALLLRRALGRAGALTAAACLPEGRLDAVAEGLKKVVTWILTTALLLFTVYLSVVRIVSDSADGATVKVAKAAISGVVPVVGGILSEVSETVMAGAGMLKNTIGIFGMLAVLAACAYPFLQLGVQYLLYKLSAFLAAAVGPPGLSKLIGGLGGAFGLVLGMTGAAALLLLVSILASVGAVMP